MSDEIETIDKNPKSWAAWKREAERLQEIIDGMALAAMDGEPVLYVMGMGQALDAETASTCKGAVDSWVAEWNQSRLPGQAKYKTVPLYRHAQPAPELAAIVERLNLSGYEYEGGEVTPQNAAAIVDTLLQQLDDEVQGRNAQPAPVVPDGYVMVPIEPTMSQELAGYKTLNDTGRMSRLMKTRLSNIYRAMLAAAPQEVK
ncbi:TPA: hypothetical protein ACW71V_004543 [Klebsiella aerogenes]|uniref:hypothetical protein n=1 Tax=Klebsiella aerogenes TaxID=548 RepID=UPI000451D80C|nr:hypothetical protein [Klebsiella aerogenes]EKV7529680.1 hypothetical protein [Klebsiella aerogenes]ELA2524306.1 hypothetical protein [Klebsiella aerogenes]EUL75819.1 hypothetical protein P831_04395 [Klebsiella aerogenes UCI 28]EUL83355.1 hypothetical protein P830_02370 [Klebsiella aerogenes UCI 27]MBF9784443.1 hypothetical protein [Klebsiella aerogenes]